MGVLFWVIVASTAPPGSVSFAGRISGFFIIVPAAGLVLFIIGVVGTIRANRRR